MASDTIYIIVGIIGVTLEADLVFPGNIIIGVGITAHADSIGRQTTFYIKVDRYLGELRIGIYRFNSPGATQYTRNQVVMGPGIVVMGTCGGWIGWIITGETIFTDPVGVVTIDRKSVV